MPSEVPAGKAKQQDGEGDERNTREPASSEPNPIKRASSKILIILLPVGVEMTSRLEAATIRGQLVKQDCSGGQTDGGSLLQWGPLY